CCKKSEELQREEVTASRVIKTPHLAPGPCSTEHTDQGTKEMDEVGTSVLVDAAALDVGGDAAPDELPEPEDVVGTSQSTGDVRVVDMTAITSSSESASESEYVRFEPLRGQWKYGQAVFARYKRTPYFYSGNIATYIGGGLFMVVFDDGTLDYRVKREDIISRDVNYSHSESHSEHHDAERGMHMLTRRKSEEVADGASHSFQQRQVMVDFSVNPPRQVFISDLKNTISDETAETKHLECGIAYEDDSTQVSDSDSSSEEDGNMTPWQQMTQTFGMGKARSKPTRRSSVSSLSGIERMSITGKAINQILPSPKGIKQTITDYLSKKTKKVQPSTISTNVVLLEQIRLMEERNKAIRSQREREPSMRVVYERKAGGRAYGTIKCRLPNGAYEIVVEEDQMISIQVFQPYEFEFLPSLKDLEEQVEDLQRTSKHLYAGRKIQVNLYPGSRFSGPGTITVEREYQKFFNVLLVNRIRLMNVPADKISALKEKKKGTAIITDDQFLVCTNKQKVNIGDQVFVKCETEYDGHMEEKLGTLNGIYSNRTAAVDFADGSTGYQILPHLISKRKRAASTAEMDVMSLKNAVLMQAAATSQYAVDVGYQVKADHPRTSSVERCVIIKKHSTSSFDVRFTDGTIALEVFPSQMIIDKVAIDPVDRTPTVTDASVGDQVLGWSSRFGRYCSAKVAAKESEGISATYSLVFDYGEQKRNVPANKIALLKDMDALSPTQKLTNYSIDTIGFEIMPVIFNVGELVLAQVHGSVKYFYGRVEAVNERERKCVVLFDSSERDENVKFASMFSVDERNRFSSFSNKMGSSSGGGERVHFTEESAGPDVLISRRRRHSGGSVGSLIMSVAGSIFRARKDGERRERRGSHNPTEAGKRIVQRHTISEQPPSRDPASSTKHIAAKKPIKRSETRKGITTRLLQKQYIGPARRRLSQWPSMDSYKVRDLVPFEGTFASWEAFEAARKAHCEKTHTLYVCRNTVRVEVANKRRKLQVPESWVFDRKVYVCTHGYKRVSRSGGLRPRQKVRYTSCKARFTAAVVCEVVNNQEVLCIKVTGQHLEHDDHPVTPDQWRHYSQNRASVIDHPYLAHEAELLRRVGSNKRALREHIESVSGKVCTMKDMHNFYARLKKRDDSVQTNAEIVSKNPNVRVESILQHFVDAHVENHVSILSGDDGSYDAICIASKVMKEHFHAFPELCFLDVSTCTMAVSNNSLEMDGYQTMYGIMCIDALGNAKPVFVAPSVSMLSPLFRRICQDFKRTHPKWTSVKLFLMEKLVPELVDVIEQEFPDARLLLCQYHVIKFLSELVTQLEFEVTAAQTQEQVRQLMKELVFARSIQVYDEAKARLLQLLENRLDHPLIIYFHQQWEPYRRLWVSYLRGADAVSALDESLFWTKGQEAFWLQLRTAFERTSASSNGTVGVAATILPPRVETSNEDSLSACVGGSMVAKSISEVLALIRAMEEEWTSKLLILEMTKPMLEFAGDQLLHVMVNCLSSFAVGLVGSQIAVVNTLTDTSFVLGEVADDTTKIAVYSNRAAGKSSKKNKLIKAAATNDLGPVVATFSKEGTQCDCDFYSVYHLPCRHLIWYELQSLQLKQLTLSAVAPRWFLRTFQPLKIQRQRESNEVRTCSGVISLEIIPRTDVVSFRDHLQIEYHIL
ncbi:TPA: hypothetical protein N0F65_002001, partial [Lagenidium giganteum]